MSAKIIMETLESLEEKIESIKWLLADSLSSKVNLPQTLGTIKRSAGILGTSYSKGITIENKLRKEWRADFSRRIN